MIKVQTSKSNRFNRTVNYGNGVKVEFDLNGIASVKHEDAIFITNKDKSLKVIEGKLNPEKIEDTKRTNEAEKLVVKLREQVSELEEKNRQLLAENGDLKAKIEEFKSPVDSDDSENEKPESPDDTSKDEQGEGSGDEQTFVEQINSMKKSELQELAEQSQLPKNEWEGKKVDELKEYMISKLT